MSVATRPQVTRPRRRPAPDRLPTSGLPRGRLPPTRCWSLSPPCSSTPSSSRSRRRSRPTPTRPPHPLSLVPNPFDLARVEAHLRPDRRTRRSRCSGWLGNSVLVTVVVTAARVFFDSLAGYALSRLHFRGRGFLFAAVLAVMARAGRGPARSRSSSSSPTSGIYDTYTAMILPLIVDAAGVFIMKQFFDSVPVSIEEAARMDGAERLPDLLVGGAADGPAGPDHADHPVVPGLVERVLPLPRDDPVDPEQQTLVTGLASLTSGELGAGTQFPLKLGAALPHDDPGRAAVLRLPAPLRPRRQRGRRQGLTAPFPRAAVTS